MIEFRIYEIDEKDGTNSPKKTHSKGNIGSDVISMIRVVPKVCMEYRLDQHAAKPL